MIPWDEFTEAAATAFALLETEFGFSRLPPCEPFIHYESPTIRVSIFYDTSRSGELDLCVMRRADVGTPKRSLGLSSLLALHDPAAWEISRAAYPSNRQALITGLEEVKALLLTHGRALLMGDETDFNESEHLERRIAEELGKHRGKDFHKTVRQVVLDYHRKA